MKTASSRRIIALPDVMMKTGFLKYVKTHRPEDYLFPAYFYHGKKRVDDPADAASKRLNNQLRAVGIHRKIESTFHSSRHTAKDIMPVARVDERIHDKQTGRAPQECVGQLWRSMAGSCPPRRLEAGTEPFPLCKAWRGICDMESIQTVSRRNYGTDVGQRPKGAKS